MSIVLTVSFVVLVAIILLLVLSCIKLSGDMERAEEQERWRRCNKCKHFMTCESGKQYFFAVTGTKCEEFENEKSSN
jgi:hypothetical protein